MHPLIIQTSKYTTDYMKQRIQQLDLLKFVCIVLMVMFHLVYIEQKYPYAKEVVYTFHMPIFLLISGYLAHPHRPARQYLRSQWWLFVPYLALELPYVVLSGILGVRGGETDLSLPNLGYRVFVDPLGPYWYLHTLILCNLSLWGTERMLKRSGWPVRLGVFACVLLLLVFGTGLVSDNVLYYFIGVTIAESGIHFLRVFRPSFWAFPLLAILCYFPGNLQYNSVGGIAITYLVICLILKIYALSSEKILRHPLFIGRNTLPILLFSPIFTLSVKPLVPLLSFDPTGMIFLWISTTLAVGGSLTIAWSMDRTGLSRWFCGRPTLLCH